MHRVLVASLLLLAACGGGGGPASLPIDQSIRLGIDSLEIAEGQPEGALRVACLELPEPVTATLLQADLVVPSGRLEPSNLRAPVEALLPRPTAVGDSTVGVFRILYGDGQNAVAQVLAKGPLFQIWLRPAAPRSPGSYAVELRNVRVVDAQGTTLPVAAGTVTGNVVIR
jgi:hypothetical protein